MKLKEKLETLSPRENSGATSSNRFDFQKDWALCKIMELHSTNQDYLVTFEFHDDILIFNSSIDPSRVSFYQIKTKKSGNWTISNLSKRPKGKQNDLNSILGKLLANLINFGEDTESLNFVSNSKLKVKLKEQSEKSELKEQIRCQEICEKEIEKLLEKMKDEHKGVEIAQLQEFTNIFQFIKSELDIENHSLIAKGRLTEFIDRYLPEVTYRPSPLYQSIFDEIRRKSNYEKNTESFEELKKKKSISRSDFEEYLSELNRNLSFKDLGQRIIGRLNSEGCPTPFAIKFHKHWASLEIERMKYNNKMLQVLIKNIEMTIPKINLVQPLYKLADLILERLKLQISQDIHLEDDYLKAIILWVLYETN